MKQNLETIKNYYTFSRKRVGPIKKFLKIGRDSLEVDWLCAHGTWTKFDEHLYNFMDKFINDEQSPYFIETLIVDHSKIDRFADNLVAGIGNISQVKETLKPITVTGKKHKDFKQVYMLAEIERQVFISGPAGTGKTTLAEQVASTMGLEFGHISCTIGMSEAHLLGRMNAKGEYLESLFVKLYENGGLFLFDEIDAADANTMLVINSALANKSMSVPNRVNNPVAKRHENFICICAANTFGHGSSEYVGRNILDAAFLDRFVGGKVLVEYDTKLEREIAAGNEKLLEVIWKIRDNVVTQRIRRIVSTRAIISGVRQLNHGITMEQYLNTFFTGWSSEEIKKAKDGIQF